MDEFKSNIENTFCSSNNLYKKSEIFEAEDNGISEFYSKAKYQLNYFGKKVYERDILSLMKPGYI